MERPSVHTDMSEKAKGKVQKEMKKTLVLVALCIGCGARTGLDDQDVANRETCPNPVASDRCDSRELGRQLCTLTEKTGEGDGTVFICMSKGGNNTGWVPYELWINDRPRCDAWCVR